MSKKRTRDQQRPRADGGQSEAPRTAPVKPDWALVVVAGLGIALTALLLWHADNAAGLPYCSEDSDCSVVQGSAWSRFMGIPLALWGLMTYALLGLVALGVRTRVLRWRWSSLIATAGFGVSLYLTAISVVVIGATCAYCLVSLGLLGVAFALGFRPSEAAGRSSWRGAGLGVAVLTAALMHADALGVFGGTAGPADPYLRELAEHLDQRGIRFYGASWCPHCNDQKELFGGAARYLPYVECSPHGRNAPRATDCEVADVRNYPTWIVDDRRIERVLTPRTLARLSGFRERGEPDPGAPGGG